MNALSSGLWIEHLVIVALSVVLFALAWMKLREGARNALFIDSMNSQAYGLILFDKKGGFVQANRRACEYIPPLADGPEAFHTIHDFLNYMYDHAVDCDRSLQRALDKTVEKTPSQSFREVVTWGDRKICLITAEKNARGGFLFVLTDITEMRQREMESHHAQKLEALGKLAAGVAHDFNNVLSIIDGYARMAADESEEKSNIRTYLGRIQAASQRGASLTKRMLTFSSHKIVSEAVIDVFLTAKEQEPLLRPLIGAAIDLSFAEPSQPAYVACSSDSLGQILMNLVVNARDAMPEGGQITISVDVIDSSSRLSPVHKPDGVEGLVVLSVSDTGVGMDRDTVQKIFDPFFTTKEQGKGTGLGLSIVYGLVREMGGTIDVQSKPGAGTTMFIYLPRSRQKPSERDAPQAFWNKPAQLQGYTALVAEDEPEILSLVSHMLEDLGMKVLRASNGAEALDLQRRHDGPIELLLTDVVMPGLNGVKLAKQICSERKEIKVIFMSGYPANGQMAQTELPRGACFMAKPVVYEKLADLICQRIVMNEDVLPHRISAPYWTAQEAKGGR